MVIFFSKTVDVPPKKKNTEYLPKTVSIRSGQTGIPTNFPLYFRKDLEFLVSKTEHEK